MDQPTFFDGNPSENGPGAEHLVLYALGDFQARGLVLAGRDLPLDRLRGALRRSAEAHGVEALGDEEAVAALTALGASVRRVPAFVAKHPYRVVVSAPLAERALDFLKETKKARRSRGSDTKA